MAEFKSHTHGATHRRDVRMGEELLELLVEMALDNGEPLPGPGTYVGTYYSEPGQTSVEARMPHNHAPAQ